MEDGYLLLEQGDEGNAYYLAVTKSGALYYNAANVNSGEQGDWKLLSVDSDTMETVH